MAVRGTRALPLVAVVALLAVLALPATATPATSRGATTLTSLESGVLQQLNQIRVQHGLVPLKLSAALTAASAQHSKEMGVDGYFDHSSRDGTAFWKRIERWYGQQGFHTWSVGENLLWSSPDVSASSALDMWLNSPEHRKILLTARWREIGLAAVHTQSAPGTYGGREVTIVTADFGVRR
jgi:uncharacterized protein YkwD